MGTETPEDDADAKALWQAEVHKPIRDRPIFKFGHIAAKLARLPGHMEWDQDEAYRILDDLMLCYARQEFADDEVLVLVADPAHFAPLKPRLADVEEEYRVNCSQILFFWRDGVMLTRDALKRYLQRSTLEGAPRLLREWFLDDKSAAGAVTDAAAYAVSAFPESSLNRKPISRLNLEKHMRQIGEGAGRIPAADPLLSEIRRAFPDYSVTRRDVRLVHKEVFGKLPPGKRSRQPR
jgi:hypothetical protein